MIWVNSTDMTKNIDQNEGSKFRTMQNDGFGASKTKDLVVGDLVEWDSWAESLDSTSFEVKQGILMRISKSERFSGWIYMAEISPFGSENMLVLPLISVRKMQKRN